MSQTLRDLRCQNDGVTRADPHTAWALVLSLALHVVLLATIALLGSKALNAPDHRTESRDVWSGDTVIVTDLMRMPALAAAVPPQRAAGQPEPTNTEPGPAVEAPNGRSLAAPAPRPAVARTTMSLGDHLDPDAPPPRKRRDNAEKTEAAPQDDLAARILAYHPPAPKVAPEAEPAAPAASTMGAAGAAESPRQLARAFARAIPAANTHEAVWGLLPLGNAGSIVIDITVDDTGTISGTTIHEKPQRPPQFLEQLVDRTLLALGGGRFVLSGASRGTQTIRLDVTLSERAVGNGPLELGFETPRPGHPGRGYFQLPSGRFVEVRVALEDRATHD